MENLDALVRENIRELKPYTSAREISAGKGYVLLDANENPFGNAFNRYPDPVQTRLKKQIAKMTGVAPGQLFLGNGSDEIIDLVMRLFCQPGKDNIVTIDPTYGMYEVVAKINGTELRKVALDDNFDISSGAMLSEADEQTKLMILCSPNNPTGNILNKSEIRKLLDSFPGIVLLDEAYIDFAGDNGFLGEMDQYPNLVVLQTLSKAWGLAGIRLGKAFASEEIVSLLNKVKFPYNVSKINQEIAQKALNRKKQANKKIQRIISEREKMKTRLHTFSFIEHIFPSDANFLLMKVSNSRTLVDFMRRSGILIRDRSELSGCRNCVRLTIGTPKQNQLVLKKMKKFERSYS
jgi:histidinol-phosphate aminotransferase